MKQFKMIRKSIATQYERAYDTQLTLITEGMYDTPDVGLKHWSTALRWEQYKQGDIRRDIAVEFAIARMARWTDKRRAAVYDELDYIESAPDADTIDISVDWVKSRYWGLNPHAEVVVRFEPVDGIDGQICRGKASGCGYDKESTAIAEALNKSGSVLKLLCDLKEQALEEGTNDQSPRTVTGISNQECCGHGAGYGAIPKFEGGVGMSCLMGLLRRCGCETSTGRGDMNNTYWIGAPETEGEAK